MADNKVALIALLEGSKILVQERKDRSKFGEEWAFFGGSVEEGETPEQAVRREVKEELGYDLKSFDFFKKYIHQMKPSWVSEKTMFTAEFPGFEKVRLLEGSGMKLASLQTAKKIKMMPGDEEIINDLIKLRN